jgi:hypothetical protein
MRRLDDECRGAPRPARTGGAAAAGEGGREGGREGRREGGRGGEGRGGERRGTGKVKAPILTDGAKETVEALGPALRRALVPDVAPVTVLAGVCLLAEAGHHGRARVGAGILAGQFERRTGNGACAWWCAGNNAFFYRFVW